MQQYDIEAYAVATMGVERIVACIRDHHVDRYGGWRSSSADLPGASYPAWVWYQGLSIAADSEAVKLRERFRAARRARSSRNTEGAAALSDRTDG